MSLNSKWLLIFTDDIEFLFNVQIYNIIWYQWHIVWALLCRCNIINPLFPYKTSMLNHSPIKCLGFLCWQGFFFFFLSLILMRITYTVCTVCTYYFAGVGFIKKMPCSVWSACCEAVDDPFPEWAAGWLVPLGSDLGFVSTFGDEIEWLPPVWDVHRSVALRGPHWDGPQRVRVLGAVAILDIRPKTHLNVKSGLPIIYYSIVKSFWNFAQSTAVSLPCSAQNFKTI